VACLTKRACDPCAIETYIASAADIVESNSGWAASARRRVGVTNLALKARGAIAVEPDIAGTIHCVAGRLARAPNLRSVQIARLALGAGGAIAIISGIALTSDIVERRTANTRTVASIRIANLAGLTLILT